MSASFFFSYASDDRNRYLDKFYDSLSERVCALLGQPRSRLPDIAFFDTQSIRTGEKWKEALAQALQTCQAFVYMSTPRYYRREMCGKEWEVFHRRLSHPETLASHPNVKLTRMIPIPWIPLSADELQSQTISAYQFIRSKFGKAYEEQGLEYVAKLDRPNFHKLVYHVADMIAEAVRDPVLPFLASMPPFEEIPHPFNDLPSPRGPSFAMIVCVVGCQKELITCKAETEAYGDSSLSRICWRPYLPPESKEILHVVDEAVKESQIEVNQNFDYKVISVQDDLSRRLELAKRNRNVVILIVDCWSLKLNSIRDIVRQYQDFRDFVVLVPWNHDDEETAKSERILKDTLKKSFPAVPIEDAMQFVPSPSDKLKSALKQALAAGQKRVQWTAPPLNAPRGTQFPTLPMI
jgi:FxsC-like protein